MSRILVCLAIWTFSTLLAAPVRATTPVDGVGTYVVLPVVSNSASFSTQVFVYNPNGQTLNLAIDYVGGVGTALAGLRTCTATTVGADRTLVVDVGTQCSLGAANNFGQLRLMSTSAANLPFTVYARVQTPAGIGFSIEGVPAGMFSLKHVVAGLRSGGVAPTYMTNCFVGTLGEATDYSIKLVNASTGAQLGSTISGSLAADALVRVLDVFTAAAVPAGTYANVNAYIDETTAGASPALVAFCTVQENTTFSADYRIGKSAVIPDASRERDSTTSAGRVAGPFTVEAGAATNIHEIYFRAPDKVSCNLTGPDVASLEFRLLDQRATDPDVLAAGGNGRVIAGGNNQSSFGPVSLGLRNAATLQAVDGAGINGRYLIQVEGNESSAGTKSYGIHCQSGNGHTRPALLGQFGGDIF